MTLAAPTAGIVLAGRYRLESALGRGGMGSVWRATHVTLGTPLAIKLMHGVEHDDGAVARFKREAQAAASIRSPHVVSILDFGVDDGTPYLAMELLEGESLDARLARSRALSPALAAKIVAETARALAKAHELGVVHRDIKPGNIFLTTTDHGEITKLLDFGIAKVDTLGAPLTQTGALVGTPRYMSPEQIEGRAIDSRADLWALAIVTYECVVGAPVFSSTSLAELVHAVCARPLPVPSSVATVPAAFDAWFARAAHRDPAARFTTARAMAEALAASLGVHETEAAASTPSPASGAAESSTARGMSSGIEETAIAPARPTREPRASGGDERAGFEVLADRTTRTLRLKFWGLWSTSLAEQFGTAVLAAYRTLEPVRPWVALSDSVGFVPQRPEVQAIHKAAIGAAREYGLARAGIIVNSALSQMQIRRLFEEAGSSPNIGFFTDEARAREFVGR